MRVCHMSTDQRTSIRVQAADIPALIVVENNDSKTEMHGELVDISYFGVRIKLINPLPNNLSDSKIKIILNMPSSGLKVVVKGTIKHMVSQTQFGFEYVDDAHEHDVDEFMFECVRVGTRINPSLCQSALSC